jgi:DNA-binding transcriptional regulator YiaG
MLAQSSTMPNIASVLKAEISRVARKESRIETQALKKASTQYRSDIAALKRQVQMLEKKVRVLAKSADQPSVPPEAAQSQNRTYRFNAKRLAAHRQRLGLSAQEMGTLLNVSGQSVYHWEAGKSRPRAAQMPAIAALRTLSKSSAAAVLASLQH